MYTNVQKTELISQTFHELLKFQETRAAWGYLRRAKQKDRINLFALRMSGHVKKKTTS